MLATKLTQEFSYFQELEKGDVIAMKGYVCPLEILLVCYRSKRQIHERQLFEDKDLHDLSRFDTSICTSTKSEPQEDYQQDYSELSNHQDDSYCKVFYISLLVLFSRLGTIGRRLVVMRIKIDLNRPNSLRNRWR